MRLFPTVRKLLLPEPASLFAAASEAGPVSGNGKLPAKFNLRSLNRPRYLIAGVVVLGIVLIVAGPRRSPFQADRSQLEQQARNGNAKAELQLALDYRDGRLGLPADPQAAAALLKQAAQRGNPDAEVLLGDAYNRGDGVARDPAAAQQLWRQAAQAGDPHAEAELGQTLINSPSLAQQSEGQNLLNQAAAQGDPTAEAALGIDSTKAPESGGKPGIASWLSSELNELTVSGQSVDSLKTRALAGDNVAQYQLAMHYRDGAWGVDADPKQALDWLQMAANHGNPVAMTTLADAYDQGKLGLVRNPGLAKTWRARAASASSAQSGPTQGEK